MILLVLAAILLLIWYFFFRRCHPVDELNGPPTVPIFGNLLSFFSGREATYKLFTNWSETYYPIYRTWQGFVPAIHPLDPVDVEVVLSSSQHIDKSHDYDFIKRWLGDGVLISKGSKWHSRRKLLTPAFHFKILEEFQPVFSENTQIMVSKLRDHVGDKNGVDISPFVTNCTLDIICETAMGTKINAQETSSTSLFVAAMHEVTDLIFYRISRPWLYPDWIFKRTKHGKKHDKCLDVLHSFSNKVIRDRKEERKNRKQDENENIDDIIGTKKKTAFLDLLLRVSEEQGNWTNEDIREEVDTFMFAGHDTTAVTMCWALLFLGSFPDVQERCAEELKEIFADSDRPPTIKNLGDMVYLERVIKETLRKRPTVAFISRQLNTGLKLKGRREFPAGTKVNIRVHDIHNNSHIYPNPDEFDPDRFLPENCIGRHPYAYLPFSAGPRNCIGQKYAMLEMKTLLSTVIRNFRLEACDPKRDIQAVPDIVLRPKCGVQLRIFERNSH